MSDTNVKDSKKMKIEEGKITPPPVQRPKTDKPKTNSYEK